MIFQDSEGLQLKDKTVLGPLQEGTHLKLRCLATGGTLPFVAIRKVHNLKASYRKICGNLLFFR